MKATDIETMENRYRYFSIKARPRGGTWNFKPELLDSLETTEEAVRFKFKHKKQLWVVEGEIDQEGLLTIISNCDWFAICSFVDAFLRENGEITKDRLKEVEAGWKSDFDSIDNMEEAT
ncbi:hypothetical protein [Desulfatibacillum aliphaticivorans]|uniref:hypothetical protein n=1 Tax=Desulfatibacillum aliphaticivorans TaxID=218208 RepID=UPI000416A0E9|nr:hypothetical protein [Desulfatibacillum aliphaticivorans]